MSFLKVQEGHSHASVGILGDRREGGSDCVFFALWLDLFYVYITTMPQGCTNIHFLMNPQQIGYRQKALDKMKKPVEVYGRPCVGMREIERKERNIEPTSANYSRFSD